MSADRFGAWAAESRAGFVQQQVASGAMPAQEAQDYAAREFTRLLPEGLGSAGHWLWCGLDGDVEVGTLWFGLRSQREVVDAFVYDFSVAPQVRRRGYGRAIMLAGEVQARALGAGTMSLNVFGHNTGAHRLYDGLGYATTATNMARRLDSHGHRRQAGGGGVRLEPMTRPELDAYRARARPEHPNLAPSVAPDSLTTPGQLLWTAYTGTLEVGMIWLDIELWSDGRHAFVRDIFVSQLHRRAGYGSAILAAAEQACRDRDVVSVGLNVHGTNPGARALFDRAGLRVTATLMEKAL